jgi:hypothetical protein
VRASLSHSAPLETCLQIDIKLRGVWRCPGLKIGALKQEYNPALRFGGVDGGYQTSDNRP